MIPFRETFWPTASSNPMLRKFSGFPSPKMQDTEATTITSRRCESDAVAERRIISIFGLMAESFSIYWSFAGM